LAEGLSETAIWAYRGQDSNGSQLWMTDLGEVGLKSDHDGPQVAPLHTRVVLLVRVGWRQRRKPGKGWRGWRQTVSQKVVSYEHYLTDFTAAQLPMGAVIDVYNGRETEESFFRGEQDAFGAQYLRTYKGEGEAAFLWILASTINLLRWTQASKFAGTRVQEAGLSKLVSQVMQIPATIIEKADAWIVLLPETLHLARQLVNAWMQPYRQLPLPLALSANSP